MVIHELSYGINVLDKSSGMLGGGWSQVVVKTDQFWVFQAQHTLVPYIVGEARAPCASLKEEKELYLSYIPDARMQE
jgi:hypothetical protein